MQQKALRCQRDKEGNLETLYQTEGQTQIRSDERHTLGLPETSAEKRNHRISLPQGNFECVE